MQRVIATRAGQVAVGALAALLAGALLMLFMARYKDSLGQSQQKVSVLVAQRLIERGTPGTVVAGGLFQAAEIRQDEVKDGALTDPAELRDRVATGDIFPGQQLTTADFAATPAGAVTGKLRSDQRAVAVPLDAAHGLIGYVRAGDRVDVYAGFNVQRIDASGAPVDGTGQPRPVMKKIIENVPVLEAPEKARSGVGSTSQDPVVIRLTDRQATELAFSAENGKVWLALRPPAGAEEAAPDLVTLETLLLGVKPVEVVRSFGGRP